MSPLRSRTSALLLVAGLTLAGCGNGDNPGEGFVTVQGLASGQQIVCGQTSDPGQSGTFNILGSGFQSEHGVNVDVIMTATSGTPFENGTSDIAELLGQVITNNLIVSQLPQIQGTVEVTLTVILPGGNEGVSLPGTVTIGGFLDGPYAFNDTYTTPTNTVLNVPANAGPLVNDFGRECLTDNEPGPQNTPPSQSGFTIAAYDTTTANGGTVMMAPDGAFMYTPPLDYEGFDSFQYTMNDQGFTASAMVTIGVNTGGSGVAATR
mgnify:CR=1 FL=1